MLKFDARDGSTARTLAVTAVPAGRRAAPLIRTSAAMPRGGAESYPSVADTSREAETGPGGMGKAARHQRPSTVTYLKGQEIFAPGEGVGLVYIVRSGCVRLYKSLADGRAVNLGILGPNTIFTQEDVSDGLATGASAEAMVESTLSVVDADDLSRLISNSPGLAAAVVSGMARRTTELQTLVEQLLARDTSVRLATTLLQLADQFGRPMADGMSAIALPLTHQSLANMIGSNRVTVTRKLLELQEQGVLRSLARNSLAVNIGKLYQYVQAATAER